MGGVDVFPWWNSNLSTSIYAYKLKVDFKNNQKTRRQFKTDTRWNNTFLLPKFFTLKWDLTYNSPYENAQTRRESFFVSNIALKKEFNQRRWIATVVYNDIFSSREYNTTQIGDRFSLKTHRDEKPYFSFKLAYVFDNQK